MLLYIENQIEFQDPSAAKSYIKTLRGSLKNKFRNSEFSNL